MRQSQRETMQIDKEMKMQMILKCNGVCLKPKHLIKTGAGQRTKMGMPINTEKWMSNLEGNLDEIQIWFHLNHIGGAVGGILKEIEAERLNIVKWRLNLLKKQTEEKIEKWREPEKEGKGR